mgnify:CR=1 FL=1
MKKVINCYKENNPVINKKLREVSVEEGLEIATELFQILNERKDSIGLAANQVGYDAAVARDIESETIGSMQLDASFSPIKRVSFNVESARVEQKVNLDRLNISFPADSPTCGVLLSK